MDLRTRLRSLTPTREKLLVSRWLRWLSPWLGHPALWCWSRRGVALGMALGVFFGLLIPLAQIPVTAAAAILLRANLPAAAASTLVTNPVTFGPVYFAAYRLGNWLTGAETPVTNPPLSISTPVTTAATVAAAANAATAAAVTALTIGEEAPAPDETGNVAVAGGIGNVHGAFDDEAGVWQRVVALGKPLLVGLGAMATITALATYVCINVVWRWRVLSQRRARSGRRRDAGA